MENKKKRRNGGSWLIRENTENISYLSTVTTHDKTRQRHVRRLLMRVKALSRKGTSGAY